MKWARAKGPPTDAGRYHLVMSKSAWIDDPTSLLRVSEGFKLADVDPQSTPGFDGKKSDGEALLAAESSTIGDLQERLYANRTVTNRSILLVLQAMDTAGKGGIIRHVVGAADPQGIALHAFKAPTRAEKRHDFLWRVRRQLPAPGFIGVFDRSHYEDVLIHRVRGFSKPEVIEERYGLISDFESELAASGTAIIKVMLQISSDEQKARLRARLDDPAKQWKFNPGDIDERGRWDAYQEAYQIALTRTSTDSAPWYVVPANRKFYARIAVQRLLIDALKGFALEWPAVSFDVEAEKARLAKS